MATFKVGQRVRFVRMNKKDHRRYVSLIGAEGVVVAHNTRESKCLPWVVEYPGQSLSENNIFGRNRAAFAEWMLAPLTDPLADAFIERIKRLEREPQPMVKEEA